MRHPNVRCDDPTAARAGKTATAIAHFFVLLPASSCAAPDGIGADRSPGGGRDVVTVTGSSAILMIERIQASNLLLDRAENAVKQ